MHFRWRHYGKTKAILHKRDKRGGNKVGTITSDMLNIYSINAWDGFLFTFQFWGIREWLKKYKTKIEGK